MSTLDDSEIRLLNKRIVGKIEPCSWFFWIASSAWGISTLIVFVLVLSGQFESTTAKVVVAFALLFLACIILLVSGQFYRAYTDKNAIVIDYPESEFNSDLFSA
jgi:hypothetical protein